MTRLCSGKVDHQRASSGLEDGGVEERIRMTRPPARTAIGVGGLLGGLGNEDSSRRSRYTTTHVRSSHDAAVQRGSAVWRAPTEIANTTISFNINSFTIRRLFPFDNASLFR